MQGPNRQFSMPDFLAGRCEFASARREVNHIPGLDLVRDEKDVEEVEREGRAAFLVFVDQSLNPNPEPYTPSSAPHTWYPYP